MLWRVLRWLVDVGQAGQRLAKPLLMLKCSPEIIVDLHCHPCLGGACAGLFQPDSEVGADTSIAAEDTGQGHQGHGKPVSRYGDGQPEWGQ